MANTKPHPLSTNPQIEIIEGQLAQLNLKSCDASMHDLSSALHDHTWFGFDLETTHYTSFARRPKPPQQKFSITSPATAKSHYSEILTQKTAGAFTDGRTSDDYRKERFSALLEQHGLEADEDRLVILAALYKDALANALEIKTGAESLLTYLRSLGKDIAIVTEGLQDAEEWTIEKLGLSEHLNELVTTNKFGKSKIDGLFKSVLEHLGIQGKDMVYIGDNYARDIVAAQEQGITTIHFSEVEDEVLSRDGTRVNCLLKIENILRLKERKVKDA